jgi:hypothetical protein
MKPALPRYKLNWVGWGFVFVVFFAAEAMWARFMYGSWVTLYDSEFYISETRESSRWFLWGAIAWAAILGVRRFSTAHFVRDFQYLNALVRLPWDETKPLLKGSLFLGLNDLIVMVFLSFIGWRVSPSFWPAVPISYLWFFQIYHVAWSRIAANRMAMYGFFFAMGTALLFPLISPFFWISNGIMLLCCYWAQATMLRAFPWEDSVESGLQAVLSTGFNPHAYIEFPTNAFFHRDRFKKPKSPIDRCLISLLFGWFAYTGTIWSARIYEILERKDLLATQSGREDLNIGVFFAAGVVVLLAAVLKAMKFTQGQRPPLTLMGRLFTGRFIIPKYDVIWVGPMLSCIAYLLVFSAGMSLSSHSILILPTATTMAFLIRMFVGPTLEDWHYTGAHQLVPLGDQSSELDLDIG